MSIGFKFCTYFNRNTFLIIDGLIGDSVFGKEDIVFSSHDVYTWETVMGLNNDFGTSTYATTSATTSTTASSTSAAKAASTTSTTATITTTAVATTKLFLDYRNLFTTHLSKLVIQTLLILYLEVDFSIFCAI